jgi:hypothetical protein
MTFLAILKDSWRETLDSKVLYFMLGLSLLVVAGVASISFQPKPADKGLEAILGRFPAARLHTGFASQAGPLRYQLEDFQQLNDAKPWNGEYRFNLIVSEVPVRGPENKEESSEGAFPTLVWISSLRMEEEKLNEEDREARKRLLVLREQTQREAQTIPPDQLKQFLNDKMMAEIRKVSPAQMERFIKQQLATHGTLETTRVQLDSQKPKEYHFAIEARGKPETYRSWPHQVSYLFGAIPAGGDAPIGPSVFEIEDTLIGAIGASIAMLIATIITAFYIPNMLQKGTIDLLLAKPIRRSTLLIYKYIGGLTFMFVVTTFIVAGIWLVLGLRSGLWSPGFLLTIATLTFQFAIFYAVSTLFSVLTRSPIVSILMACLAWVVLFGVGWGYRVTEGTREFELWPSWVYTTADVAHFILPRYKDIDSLNSQVIARDLLSADSAKRKGMDDRFSSIKWGESLGFTTAFIALLLGLSCWRFATRDY